MRVGVRGMDLILSRSGRYIDALCLRKSIKESRSAQGWCPDLQHTVFGETLDPDCLC